jgi:hypothetical protein
MRTRHLALAAACVLLASCGSSSSTIGPLTIEPPEGWLVVDRQPGTIKVANGSIGSDTGNTAGNATAVFDVYVDSAQTVRQFRSVLRENNVEWKEDEVEVDSYDAIVVMSEDSAFAPASEVAFIPEWNVRIVYRAAYGDKSSDFARHRDEFRDALASITLEGRPPDRA